jgi:prepilin-type N-terminal cleavage/methylation domain-containing protein
MTKVKIMSQKGFSLIELSMVLIIIGLLVAGITGGANLIKSAELRSIITEARSYRTAVNAYYTSQDTLPGDDTTTRNGHASRSGNGNGRIEALNSSNEVEGIEAINDMSDSKVRILDLAQIVLPTPTAGKVPALTSAYMISAKYKGGYWTFDYATTPASGSGTATVNANILLFTAPTLQTEIADDGNAVEVRPNIILTGIDAYSIVNKIDNGVFTSGAVLGLNAESTTAGTDAGECLTTATAKLCALAFKLDL